jgi:hypothetical protein
MIACLCFALPAFAVNHVRMDTISNVPPGTTGLVIGGYVTNDIPIVAAVFPLEIRTCNAGAYITGPDFSHGLNPAGRMYNSPLGPLADPNGQWPAASFYQTVFAEDSLPKDWGGCVRPFDPTRSWVSSHNSAMPDFISPDAVFLATVSTGDPRIGEEFVLPPGSDPPGVPSYQLVVNVGMTRGLFVIDTTCTTPANTLMFVDDDANANGYTPSFEKGVIGVGVAVGPCSPEVCDCPCLGEPATCGGEKLGILDVVTTIDVAFRSVPAVQDPSCPYVNTDVDCSGGTDIVDVVKCVNVEFRNADRATEFCDPCNLQ